MDDAPGDSKIFSVRIVSIDYYMAPPISGLDISYSSFQGGKVKEVPVIRVYGSTTAGQKACIHIHQALPYLYIPCSDIPLQSNIYGDEYKNALLLAIEKNLKLMGNAGSKRQHVHGSSIVRARKLYGYHSLEELFVKIYLYYPHDVPRTASLLLGGAIFGKSLQPHESHIPFLLQFLVDYNLYGMGHLHLIKMKLRHPVPDDFFPWKAQPISSDAVTCTSADSQADTSGASSSGSPVWKTAPIPASSGEPAGSPDQDIHLVKRQSTCELEGDTIVGDILNQQFKMYTSFSQTESDVRLVLSLIPIWEEEYERSGMHGVGMLPDPGKPLPEDVLKTLSNGLEYENKLQELCSKEEEKFSTTLEKEARSMLPARSSTEEGDFIGLMKQNPVGQTMRISGANNIAQSLMSQESVFPEVDCAVAGGQRYSCLFSSPEQCALQMAEESGPKAADAEALALLKWFASSQAAEDINSDDELARDVILSPLLPTSSIDKVLEKATIDYESESQQECQDILDSVEERIHFEVIEEKEVSIGQNKSSLALSEKVIPQVDGAGDNDNSTPADNSSGLEIDMELMRAQYEALKDPDSGFNSTSKRNKLLWVSLPLSVAENTISDLYPLSKNVNDRSNSKTESDGVPHSLAGYGLKNISDTSCDSLDTGYNSLEDVKPLVGCSMRDLMRKKRRHRIEPSERGNVRENEGSVQVERDFGDTKLEFNMEQFEDMQPLQSSNYNHVKAGRQTELCEKSLCAATNSATKVSQMIKRQKLGVSPVVTMNQGPLQVTETSKQGSAFPIDSVTNDKEMESDSNMHFATASDACINKFDQSVVKRCLKFDPGDGGLVDGKFFDGGQAGLRQSDTYSSGLLICERKGETFDGADKVGNEVDENRISAELVSEMVPKNTEHKDVATGAQFDQSCCRQEATGSGKLICAFASMVKESSNYVSMTFHKKPHTVSMNTTSGSTSFPATSKCLPSKGDINDEGTSDQGRLLAEFVPFITDCQEENASLKRYHNGHNPAISVPTVYQDDESYSHMLTPAFSPPSVDSVSKWLSVRDTVNSCGNPSADSCGNVSPESTPVCSLMPILNQLNQENQSHPNREERPLYNDTAAGSQEGRSNVNIKDTMKSSQDVSQISGPSGRSKLTPLSQIGFRDPASVGEGQQLTLLSVEVLTESRGDLRPDPQFDAINIIAVAIQNDNVPDYDIHVLLRSAAEPYGRNLDEVFGCKVQSFSGERDLLGHFVKIISSFDPDILMGWDVQGASLGFLAERASCLGVDLLNKISRTPSETKTDDRDSDIRDKGNMDAVVSEHLIADPILPEEVITEDEWGRTHASGVHVSGRIILNVWRLMRGEVKLNMYTVEAVAEAVLRRKLPSIHWKILDSWFLSGPGRARYRCIVYLAERAKLNLEIMNQLDMINRTSELARIFGIDFFSVLSRGSQYRVESMLIRLAHTQNYIAISPGHQQVASQPAMECLPLVMEPESGFYADPVIVFDFQSLYPSMIIAYNLCFSTCLGKVVPSKTDVLGVSMYSPELHVLRDLNGEVLLTPNGVMYVPSKVRKGVLPCLLEEILSTRIMVKQAMKKLNHSQQILHRVFNARQLALKLIANVTYGYTAAGFSGRMPCAELADSIVQCGRRTLENAISFVNSHDEWNARVIYGDTDSMFVILKGRNLRESFKIGQEIAATITALNPNPVTLKMEKIYQPCFLLTKKRYVGYSYESLDQVQPVFDAKGIETVRRDTCGAVSKIMEKSLRVFFEQQDISKVKSYLQRQWSRILSGRMSLQDFVFAKEVRLGTYSTRASSSLPPAAIVATKAMRADPRAEPRYGERIPYVVIHGEPGARLVDMVVDPLDLLAINSSFRLNDLYYIHKQIIPALQRVFGLLGCDLNQWFLEMPRLVRDAPSKHHFNAANSHRTRIDYYYLSKHCVLCGEIVHETVHLCDQCSKNGGAAAVAVTGRTAKLERDIKHLASICQHCGGGDWLTESGVKCTSLACAVFYERRKVQKELGALSSIATEAGLYPKCMVEWKPVAPVECLLIVHTVGLVALRVSDAQPTFPIHSLNNVVVAVEPQRHWGPTCGSSAKLRCSSTRG
ncbi:hypothetical protein Nepgr_009589 [Nepenthes gracilis]|uniref:DNA polymerase zeta catalytic subunit n=1 Tax=Nepenthes gracilis TaxID=150966 RepID=A0AAD3SBL7_NEPGR|nr:hypothetical protein Nepgr_009589 [Nepenthes gracilis]